MCAVFVSDIKTNTYNLIMLFRKFQISICILCIVRYVVGQSRILSFQNCQGSDDCFENSFCYKESDGRKKCRCKEDFVLVEFNKTTFECLPVVEYGVACTVEIQCQVKLGSLGTCDATDNVCKCIEDAHFAKDNMCHETVALGGICKTANNCLLSDNSYGFCFSGSCVCDNHEHPVPGENRCVHSSRLNKECELEENCVTPFSHCNGGICKCIPGYVESENNRKCLLAASSVGSNCTETIQCREYVKDSFCYNNTCSCESAHHGYGNECVPDAKLGDKCTHDKECMITAELQNFVACRNQTCTCLEGESDEHYYGCIIPSRSLELLPSVVIILVAFLVVLIQVDISYI